MANATSRKCSNFSPANGYPNGEYTHFISAHYKVHPLQASLILADALHAIGVAMSLKWVQAGRIDTGTFCTAQGQHLFDLLCSCRDIYSYRDHTFFGVIGYCIFIFGMSPRIFKLFLIDKICFFHCLQAIAVYTFLGVWVMKDIISMKFTLGVITTIWSFATVLVIVATSLNRDQHFWAPDPVSHPRLKYLLLRNDFS